MRRTLVILLVALLAVLVGSQLLLPRYLEGRIADRLTQDGGTAEVSLEALPAVRLLSGDGERISVTGNGLRVDVTAPRPEAFDRLEGFEEVDVRLTDVSAGPFRTRSFNLTRSDSSAPYELELSATVSPRDFSRFAAAQVAGTLGTLLGDIAGSALPLADAPIAIDLQTEIERIDGRWRSTGGAGTVADLPAGPIAEALAAAIVARL